MEGHAAITTSRLKNKSYRELKIARSNLLADRLFVEGNNTPEAIKETVYINNLISIVDRYIATYEKIKSLSDL